MPYILLFWPMTSEADAGGMVIEVEPSHQYSITFCCCATVGSRGAVWQNGIWHGSVDEAKVCHWIPPCGKDGTHWHSLKLDVCLWRPNGGCEHSEVVGGAFQQWEQQQWVTSAGADFEECGIQALVHCWWMHSWWWWLCWKTVVLAENLPYQIVLLSSLL